MTEQAPEADPVYVDRVFTCHTPGCGNDGVGITLATTADAAGLCGACGNPITDIVP